MSFTVQDLINDVRITLRDNFVSGHTHSDDDLLGYVNRALRAVMAVDKSANITTGEIQMVAGIVQELPAKGMALVKTICNANGDNSETIGLRKYGGGHTIKMLPLSTVATQSPNWAGERAKRTVVTAVYDKENPTSFMVSPPNDGTGKIIATYAIMPDPVTAITDPIPFDDIYRNPMINYVCGCALLRDSETQSNAQRATAFMQAFASELGAEDGSTKAVSEPSTVKE